MNISPQGPVLIVGAGSELARHLAIRLQEEGVPTLGLCHSVGGLAACHAAGLSAVGLESPEDVPNLCLDVLGRPPAAYCDFLHSRFEALQAMAAPDAIDRWALEDIALRGRLLRAVTRTMLPQRRGRCLFISSSAAESPAPGQGWYASAKLAGEGLFRSVGLELAGRGITTCSLRLSWIDSGRGAAFLEGRKDKALLRMPTRKLVDIEESTATMLFLLSPPAHSINAQTVTLDGGFSAAKNTI